MATVLRMAKQKWDTEVEGVFVMSGTKQVMYTSYAASIGKEEHSKALMLIPSRNEFNVRLRARNKTGPRKPFSDRCDHVMSLKLL